MVFSYHMFLFIPFPHPSKDNVSEVHPTNMLRFDAQFNRFVTTLSYVFLKMCKDFLAEERCLRPELLPNRLHESVLSLIITNKEPLLELRTHYGFNSV